MKIFLIIQGVIILAGLLYFERNKVWVKWIYYSVTYRIRLHQIKKNLASLNENNRLLALVEWLGTDHWFKKYWFGRKVEKYILKEVEKFK